MAQTSGDVRREIELTRERMSGTLDQLEHKLNVMGMVREHPIPALAVALGAGLLLSSSGADTKAAAAALAATKGASGKMGEVLDDVVAQLMQGVHAALDARVNGWVEEVKVAIGAPAAASIPPRAD